MQPSACVSLFHFLNYVQFSQQFICTLCLAGHQMLHFKFPQSTIIKQQAHVSYEAGANQKHLHDDPKISRGKRPWKKFVFVKIIFFQNVRNKMTATQEFLLAFRLTVITHELLEMNTNFEKTKLIIIQNVLGFSFFFSIRVRGICLGCTAACRLIVQPWNPLIFGRSHFCCERPQ